MSERRLIQYYKPRIQVPVNDMFDKQGQYALYCLPVDGAEALRRMIDYLKREVTFVGEPIDGYSFLGPTKAELDDIRDLVAETEDYLMSGCDFTDIVDILTLINASLAPLQCLCNAAISDQSARMFSDQLQTLLDSGEVVPTTQMPTYDFPATAEGEACAIAQLYFAFTYELMTETVLPAAKTTFDNLLPVLAGVIASLVGGPVVGLAMYAIAEVIQEVLELGYVVAEQNYINWLLSVKQEWVCAAYAMLTIGASSEAIAGAIDTAIITASDTISLGDKIVTRLVGGTLGVTQAKIAYDMDTQWAQDNVDVGYCDTCVIVPAGCLPFGACAPEEWVGGVIECVDGFAVNKGGLAHWIGGILNPPISSYLVVAWYPRADVGGIARANFGLKRVSDLQHFNVITGVNSPIDVLKISYAAIPSALWLNDCYFDVQQSAYWAEPVYWCVTDVPPT